MLDAMARPGEIRALPVPPGVPPGWNAALIALALSLLDQETPVWLDPVADSEAARTFLRFHCAAPLIERPADAAFAVIADPASAPPLHSYSIGDPQYPDRSATVLIGLPSLTGGPLLQWTGPGIQSSAAVAPGGLPSRQTGRCDHPYRPCFRHGRSRYPQADAAGDRIYRDLHIYYG